MDLRRFTNDVIDFLNWLSRRDIQLRRWDGEQSRWLPVRDMAELVYEFYKETKKDA